MVVVMKNRNYLREKTLVEFFQAWEKKNQILLF
jgi:hypothetical protein